MSIVKNKDSLKYYIGVDIGTNSVGWAVIDENGCLLNKGKLIYGGHDCLIKLKQPNHVEDFVQHVDVIIKEEKESFYYN